MQKMPSGGLGADEVREREEKGLVNRQVDRSQKTVRQIIRENTLTYFNLIFLILALLLIAARAYTGLTFLPVIIANTLIGIAQEIYAKSVLDKLSIMNAPTAKVVRSGSIMEIPIERIVKDDIIFLSSGIQIPADAEIVSGSLSVNESLLTGESDEIEKNTGSTLMSGSFVVSGEAYAVVTAVGADSYINQLLRKAKSMPGGERSEMVRSIDRLVQVMGIILIPMGVTLFVQSYWFRDVDFSTSVSSMVAAVIGMIPEGLYLLVSVTLAMSAARLALSHVMLHDMKSIESLARVDVLCADKTGTITDTKMLVAGAVTPGSSKTYDPFIDSSDKEAAVWSDSDDEEIYEDLTRKKKSKKEKDKDNSGKSPDHSMDDLTADVRDLISDYLLALSDDNISMKALRDYFITDDKGKRTGRRVVKALPFSSKNKYSAVHFNDATCILGAPEIVLKDSYDTYRQEVESYASRGLRVMVFAKADGIPESPAEIHSASPLAFILLQNPIRPNARKTFDYFKRQSVTVKVISGDNPVTVSNVARLAGIDNASQFIDARELDTLDKIADAVEKYTVFGRVTPEQKRLIIRALQADGHTVAMTGDGVNDILAMKDADCSIAMASGSDAAVQSAEVALLDSEFSHMPEIVGEGRRVINNIERSATLFLVKNIFSVLLGLFSILSTNTYPLKPAQISLISTFNIGIPAFFLAMEPNHKRSSGHFMSRVLIRALPAAITDFLSISALVVFAQTFHVSAADVSIAATFLLGIVGFIILFNISSPQNAYRIAVLIGCIAGLIVTAYFFNGLFEISFISKKCAMLFVLFAIATEPFMRYLTKLSGVIETALLSHDKKRKTRGGKRYKKIVKNK
jgi:cation-transporting ATPase E